MTRAPGGVYKTPLPCRFCGHSFRAHDFSVVPVVADVPCTDCSDGACRKPDATPTEGTADAR